MTAIGEGFVATPHPEASTMEANGASPGPQNTILHVDDGTETTVWPASLAATNEERTNSSPGPRMPGAASLEIPSNARPPEAPNLPASTEFPGSVSPSADSYAESLRRRGSRQSRRSAVQATLSRKAAIKRAKENQNDDDWERRLYWTRDLYEIRGIHGLLMFDPNNHYRLRPSELKRRKLAKEAKTAQRRANRAKWRRCCGLFKSSSQDHAEFAKDAETSKEDGEEPISTFTDEAEDDEDVVDFQTVMELSGLDAKDGDTYMADLHTDPDDPEYVHELEEFADIVKKHTPKPFHEWLLCGSHPLSWPIWRIRLRRTLRDPRYSILANFWSLLISFTVVVSLATLVLESVQPLVKQEAWRSALTDTSLAVLLLFTAELLLTWFTMKNLREFFTWSNLINILTVLPPATVVSIRYSFDANAGLPQSTSNGALLQVMQKLLVLRVFKLLDLTKRSSRMDLIFKAVALSYDGILSLIIADFVIMIFFSTIIFYAEQTGMYLDTKDAAFYYTDEYGGGYSPFQNIPVTCWFAIVSITTTGYGDMVPRTWLGQTCTATMLVIAVALLAFPLSIINANFSALIQAQEAGKAERRKRREARREMEVQRARTIARGGAEPRVAFSWQAFGTTTDPVRLIAPRSAVQMVLGQADIDTALRGAGWQVADDGSFWRTGSLLGDHSEFASDAMRAILLNRTFLR